MACYELLAVGCPMRRSSSNVAPSPRRSPEPSHPPPDATSYTTPARAGPQAMPERNGFAHINPECPREQAKAAEGCGQARGHRPKEHTAVLRGLFT
jgi:hypothetical protein